MSALFVTESTDVKGCYEPAEATHVANAAWLVASKLPDCRPVFLEPAQGRRRL